MVWISALELHYVVIIMPCVKNRLYLADSCRLGVWGRSCFRSLVLGVFSTGPGMDKAFSKSFLNK